MHTTAQGMGTMAGTSSLAQAHSHAVLRAQDYQRAKRFYTETLGLEVRDVPNERSGMVMTGEGTSFLIYENPKLSAPQNTALGFAVKDFDKTFEELKGRGVKFEDYDIPEMGIRTQGGVAEMQGYKGAWFTDSEGNILQIGDEGMMK